MLQLLASSHGYTTVQKQSGHDPLDDATSVLAQLPPHDNVKWQQILAKSNCHCWRCHLVNNDGAMGTKGN